LKALWPLLKKNGILLYATCSIFPDENTNIVKKFLSMHQEAEVIPIDADWGIATECGRQLLPNPTDGFFYAKIKKLN
jgi:16S rRNA (cytosine967-C5)-methyltransferase